MTLVNPFAAVPQQPSYQVLDSGASGASGANAGGGSPAAAAGSQGAGSGGGASSPVSLADDTPITVDGKQTTWKDYRTSQFVAKSDYDQVRNLTKQEIQNSLKTLAAQIQQQQQRQGQQAAPRVDPLAGVRDLPIVDGKTLASLYEQGYGPLAQAIQQQQQTIQKLTGALQKLQGGVGSMAEKQGGKEFEQRLDTAISQLGEKVDLKDPFIRELAQDVFHSYEWAKGKEDQEFQTYLKTRYDAAEKHFKAKMVNDLKAAKERKWQRPGGNATPSGQQQPFARATTRDIARSVFAGSPQGT